LTGSFWKYYIKVTDTHRHGLQGGYVKPQTTKRIYWEFGASVEEKGGMLFGFLASEIR